MSLISDRHGKILHNQLCGCVCDVASRATKSPTKSGDHSPHGRLSVEVVRALFHNAPRRKRHAMPKLKNMEPPEADFFLSLERPKRKKHRPKAFKSTRSHFEFVSDQYESCTIVAREDQGFRLTISTVLSSRLKPRGLALSRVTPVTKAAGADDPVFETDARACPRDPEDFKIAVAFEIDRLREKRIIFDE